MKLPWDEKYIKISFHVVVTFIVVYVLKLCINGLAHVFTNLNSIFVQVGGFIGDLFSLFAPLVVAVVVAYLLEPAVAFFQRHFDRLYALKLYPYLKQYAFFRRRLAKAQSRRFAPRTAGVLLTLLAFFGVIAFGASRIASQFGNGGMAGSLAGSVSKTVNDGKDLYTRIQLSLAEYGGLEFITKYITEFIDGLLGIIQNLGNALVASVASAGNGIIAFLLGLVISFYFMRDKDAILNKISDIMDIYLPKRLNTKVRNALSDANAVFSGYIRGQLTDAVIMAILISLLLSALNVNFAVMIGIFSGISNLIPYFGAIMAYVLSITVALFSGEPISALYAAIGILILQQIDAMFIVPKVVGESVELSPVLVLLSLSVAGTLFGIPGMVLAVPVTAIIKLCLVRITARQKARKAD